MPSKGERITEAQGPPQAPTHADMVAMRERAWEDWCLAVYGDQDFTVWERYRTWLLARLKGGGRSGT